MTERPIKTDDPGDPHVSAAYRELADERTPEHLDHVVLNAARGAARPRWSKAIAWLRPEKVQLQEKPESVEASDLPRRADDSDAGTVPPRRESGLEEAETRVRQRAISDVQAPAAILSTAPASNLAQETATERYCDESETANPNTWLACILELERQGLYDAARLERDRLAEAFPPPELP
jgi:hypothetical protein